jgi:hypothetical protein
MQPRQAALHAGGQAPVVRGAGLEVAEEPAVGQGMLAGADASVDVLSILGLGIPRAPAIGPHGGDMRLPIDGGDRRVSIQRQDGRPALVFIGGEPRPQVARRQDGGDRHRPLLVDAAGRPRGRPPEGESTR